MSVCCECCVLSSRSLCDELINRPEESCRLYCVIVCDLETSRMRRPWSALGCSARKRKKGAYHLGIESEYTRFVECNIKTFFHSHVRNHWFTFNVKLLGKLMFCIQSNFHTPSIPSLLDFIVFTIKQKVKENFRTAALLLWEATSISVAYSSEVCYYTSHEAPKIHHQYYYRLKICLSVTFLMLMIIE